MIKCGHEKCNPCNTDGYEWDDRVFLYRFLATHGDSVFIDVGAHVGLYTYSINQLLQQNEVYKSKCYTISIEPDISVLQFLYDNVSPCMVLGFTAWDVLEPLGLIKDGHIHGRIACQGEKFDICTVGVPIDVLSIAFGTANTLAMKIDVEGTEYKVLRGACQTLEKACNGALVVELSNEHLEVYGTEVGDVVTLLDDLKYQPVDKQQLIDVGAGYMRNVHFIKEDSK